ncbi:15762_t:CDS:2 [Funneliformis geosporum]|uniref:15762_t:CDS:1 n=1 Tax=Funneliformis geosporum TaxID=1117311 RepID=A0A9W4SPU6_9GLOM|nr:15762_t:CDS:2 [Funneliformis geosporum]
MEIKGICSANLDPNIMFQERLYNYDKVSSGISSDSSSSKKNSTLAGVCYEEERGRSGINKFPPHEVVVKVEDNSL